MNHLTSHIEMTNMRAVDPDNADGEWDVDVVLAVGSSVTQRTIFPMGTIRVHRKDGEFPCETAMGVIAVRLASLLDLKPARLKSEPWPIQEFKP